MSTVLKKLGPADHGRPMTLEEFLTAGSVEGYHYELIDGELYVSPLPNLPENRVEDWVYFKLKLYAHYHPEVLNFVSNKARVFVPGRSRVTTPEPDVAAYHSYPLELSWDSVRWQDVSPILVVEVLSLDDPDKDLVRNVALYLQVPSIKEYWLFDTRQGSEQPHLQVRRRYRAQWSLRKFGPGETYTTKLLPGFALILDPPELTRKERPKRLTTKTQRTQRRKERRRSMSHDPSLRERANQLSKEIIGAAIEVHRHLGPGLLESAYEACLCHELSSRQIAWEKQIPLPIVYKGVEIDAAYRIDIKVHGLVILELKSVDKLEPIHEAQLLTYLRLSHLWLGLLINFNVVLLKDGIKRLVLD